LYQVGPDGRDERLLFDDFPVANPLWSPNRRYVTFFDAAAGRTQLTTLYLFDYESGGLITISDLASPDPFLAWSPDSTRFAYVANDTGGLSPSRDRTYLSIFNVVSGEMEAIYAPPLNQPGSGVLTDVTSPTWSPEGDELAFVATRSPSSVKSDLKESFSDIYVADLASGEKRNVTHGAIPTVAYASWSPVADQLLTWDAKRGTVWFTGFETTVHLLDIHSGALTRLTARTDVTGSPVWSPDGMAYALVANNVDLIVLSLDGSVLASGHSDWDLDGYISWSPTGNALLAVAEEPFEPSVLLSLQNESVPISPLVIEFDGSWPNLGPQWTAQSR